jgi:hypothetical protein
MNEVKSFEAGTLYEANGFLIPVLRRSATRLPI